MWLNNTTVGVHITEATILSPSILAITSYEYASIVENRTSSPIEAPPDECILWSPANHIVFQVANAFLCLGIITPNKSYGNLVIRIAFVIGFLSLSVWAWLLFCSPDIFAWNFVFVVVNVMQMFFIIYRLRQEKFEPELEDVYCTMFQPLRVSRVKYKKLTHPDYCTILTLQPGEMYATRGVSKTDRLSLLITGKLNVHNNNAMLHDIHEKQFIDAPEFESTVTGDEKYQVSICAMEPCSYIMWPRQTLDYLLLKDTYLATLMNTLIGRDITNKLYALNEKAQARAHKSTRVDLRLAGLSSSQKGGSGPGRPAVKSQVSSSAHCSLTTEHEGPADETDEDMTDVFSVHANQSDCSSPVTVRSRTNTNTGPTETTQHSSPKLDIPVADSS